MNRIVIKGLVAWFVLVGSARALTLAETCNKAYSDVDCLKTYANNFDNTNNSLEYRDSVQVVANDWRALLDQDDCSESGCDINSDQARVNSLITIMTNLNAKMQTINSRNELDTLRPQGENSSYQDAFTVEKEKITRACTNSKIVIQEMSCKRDL